MSDGGGIGGKLGNITTEALGNLSDAAGSELKNVAGTAISQTTGLQIKPQPKITQQQIDQMASADKASTAPLLEQHRKELQEISEHTNPPAQDSKKITPEATTNTKQSNNDNESLVKNRSMIMHHHEEAQKLGQKSPEEQAKEEQEKHMKQLEDEQKQQEEEAKKMAEPVELPGSAPKGPGVPGKKTMPLVVKDAVDKDIGRQKKG